MAYVDGFVLPLPADRVDDYRRLARRAGKIFIELGALEYNECVGDDLSIPGMREFPKLARAKEGETVIFAWITYRSRAHRDSVNKRVMSDPRLAKMMESDPPFDCKRMAYGGFKSLVRYERE